MKEIGRGLKALWAEDRGLLLMMILSLGMGLVFAIFALVTLNPASSVTKIGYGDIGGYRDGSWQNMFVWPLLALALAVLNNLIAVKVSQKSGTGMARVVVGTTMLLILIGFVTLARLLGES